MPKFLKKEAFLFATFLILRNIPAFTKNYFNPHTLAITHIMALGWGTMMILGASHQLVPVLIEGKLYSNKLAITSFGDNIGEAAERSNYLLGQIFFEGIYFRDDIGFEFR